MFLSGCRELNPGRTHPKGVYYRCNTARKRQKDAFASFLDLFFGFRLIFFCLFFNRSRFGDCSPASGASFCSGSVFQLYPLNICFSFFAVYRIVFAPHFFAGYTILVRFSADRTLSHICCLSCRDSPTNTLYINFFFCAIFY